MHAATTSAVTTVMNRFIRDRLLTGSRRMYPVYVIATTSANVSRAPTHSHIILHMNSTLGSPVVARPARRTFSTPRPNTFLMWALGFVNRWFILSGLPFLRHVPGLRDLPGIRGYLRIRLDLPDADRARLAGAVNPSTAAFIGPNHPEFGADWMIDKELSTLVAPTMASWAAHEIVASAPRFWRANNLVSNSGGDEAMEYSIAWAIAGRGVLLHPEGSVRWTSSKVHPLFSGIAEMATETARRLADRGSNRAVYIVPIVWKLRYVGDVSAAMHRDMTRIEVALGLPLGDSTNVALRFQRLQDNILALQAERFGYSGESMARLDFFDRQDAFRQWLVDDLESRYAIEPSDSMERRIRRLERAIRAERVHLRGAPESPETMASVAQVRDDLARADEAMRLGGFTRDVYATPLLSQEQIAESLKRLRAALLRRGTTNVLHNYLPRPYGARVAHVRVPEPILIDPARASSDSDADRAAYVEELLDQTRRAMQAALDAIHSEEQVAAT